MAVTLNDLAKLSREPLRTMVIEDLVRDSDLLAIVPFESINTLETIVTSWDTLPSVGFRKIGGGYTESSGTHKQDKYAVKPMGIDIDIDNLLLKQAETFQKLDAAQIQMALKSVACTFAYYFIKGSPAVDADGFYGLEYLVDTLPARQKFALGTAGTPYDATADAAHEQAFLDGLHRLSKVVGGADAFFMNEEMYLGVGKVLRRANLLDVTKDQYDRTFKTFGKGKLIDVGLQSDQATEIITDTEDPGDEGDDTTSIYAVRFDETDGLTAIQNGELDAYWVGGDDHELEAKPGKRIRIDWAVGLAPAGRYCIARMYNLKPALSWT